MPPLRLLAVFGTLMTAGIAPARSAGQLPAATAQSYAGDSAWLERTAGELIRSSDLKDKTWGAYLTAKLSLTELRPDLERLLGRQPVGSPLQEKWLTSAVLDALIQTHAALSSEKLLPFIEQFPDQTLILLARHPEDNRATILDLLERPLLDVHRQLLRGTLTQARAPGFAAHLLQGYRVVSTVYVRTPGTGGFGGGVGGGGSGGIPSCVLGPELPSDYPPGVCYSLGGSLDAQPGVSVLMALPAHPIYATRTEVATGSRDYPVATRPNRTERFDSETTDYFAALLDQPKDLLPMREFVVHHLEWHGTEDYVEQIKRIRRKINASYAELLAQLQNRALLSTADDFPHEPLIEWSVEDLRKDRLEPIPGIE